MQNNQVLGGKNGITRTAVYAGLAVILALLPPLGLSTYYIHVLIGVFIYTVAAVSLRLTNISGQGSLGQAGFMCIGAYTSAILSKDLGWTPWFTMILGALLTFVVGLLIAIPFSRLRGIYFTMISLFFAMAVIALAELFQDVTGGESGLAGVPALFSLSKIPYYYFFLGMLIVCLLIMYRLEFSRIGLTWKAIAQSHPVASSIGINEAGQRILCLALGAFFAGLAGAGYAHYYQMLSVNIFSVTTSIYLFIYMMVGGVNYFSGPIIGTAVLIIIPTIFRDLNQYVPFVFAAILLVVIYLMPEGLAGLPSQVISWTKKLRREKQIIAEKEAINHVP
jgi:branched-chain amino acid transport system permease protein